MHKRNNKHTKRDSLQSSSSAWLAGIPRRRVETCVRKLSSQDKHYFSGSSSTSSTWRQSAQLIDPMNLTQVVDCWLWNSFPGGLTVAVATATQQIDVCASICLLSPLSSAGRRTCVVQLLQLAINITLYRVVFDYIIIDATTTFHSHSLLVFMRIVLQLHSISTSTRYSIFSLRRGADTAELLSVSEIVQTNAF